MKPFAVNAVIRFVFFFLPFLAVAQVQDNFEDKFFNESAIWKGDTQFFELNNGNLRSKSSIINHAFSISTISQFTDTTIWMLAVELAFNTSGSNYVDFFLSADSANLSQSLNAYFVRIGNTQDEVSLFKVMSGMSPQKVIDGRDKILDKSFNRLIVKVQYINGIWDLWVNQQGALEPLEYEGQFIDSTYNLYPHTGLLIRQSTASFFGKHSFDFFYSGPPIRDTIPPILQNAEIHGNDSIWFVLSKPIHNLPSDLGNHISLNPFIRFNSIGLSESKDSIFLKLETPLQSFENYSLIINNLVDIAGNSLDTLWDFYFVFPEVANRYDIVIHEVMTSPVSTLGLPSFQYVEIKNVSQKAIRLDSFMLSDRSSNAFLRPYLFMPDSILIICPNSAAIFFSAYGSAMGVSNFPSLNITNDDIFLRDKFGNLIHHIAYESTWYKDNIKAQGGYSLEMIDKTNPCATSQNWLASNAIIGGTPGRNNSVEGQNMDTIAPIIRSVYPLNLNAVELKFNETLDSLSVVSLLNWELIPNTNKLIKSTFVYPSSVILEYEKDLESDILYSIKANRVADCVGNVVFVESKKFGLPQMVLPLDIVINEIMINPEPTQLLPPFQYIELKNISEKIIDLSTIYFSTSNSKIQLPSNLLLPDSFVVISSIHASGLSDWAQNHLMVSSFPSMNKTVGELTLTDNDGSLLFVLNYTDDWYNDVVKKQGGFSLEMKSVSVPCSQMPNWTASKSLKGGTPGYENSVKENLSDTSSPLLVSVYPTNEYTLRLEFNEIISSQSILNEAVFFIPELGITVEDILKISAYQVFLELPFEIQVNEFYTIEVSGVRDCVGNEMLPVFMVFGLPVFPQKRGDILINEILFNPPAEANEFVELYNFSNYIVDLKHLRIGNLRDDGSIREALDLFPEGYLFLPKSYICFGVHSDALCATYNCKNKQAILSVNRMPSYPQSKGGVVVLTSTSVVLDSLLYDENMHFPLIKNKRGVSLERIAFERETTERTNWVSASTSSGFATPGYLNSQSETPSQGLGKFWLTRKVFSPNGDGFEDRISVGYSMPAPGFVANLYVFDSQGVYLGHPIRSHTIGLNGELVWNGFLDESSVCCSPGIYVIMVEAFSLDGTVHKSKFAVSLIGY